MHKHRTVDDYIESAEHWQAELRVLRKIMLATALEETVKWGAPCYTCDGTNVVALVAFQSYVGLWFFQGALLADPEKVLINAQEGRTRAQRQWRFGSPAEIRAPLVRAYVREAIDLHRRGKILEPERNKPVRIPPPLAAALRKRPRAAARFAELTKGKQRAYADYITDAKRDKTREQRIIKVLPIIEAGKGLHDKYR